MSDWKKSAAARRDARHTKSDPRAKPEPTKKNTKKWCKGKVGREHVGVCRDFAEVKRLATDIKGRPIELCKGWKVLVCDNCGKELDTYYPPSALWGRSVPKPDWVKE